jgi:hypothetical protein
MVVQDLRFVIGAAGCPQLDGKPRLKRTSGSAFRYNARFSRKLGGSA